MGVKIGYQFVPFPQEIWDQDLPLTLGEFRLLGYLLRHQIGFGTKPALITDDELLRGIKRADGTRRDTGCGLRGTNNLKEARRRLTERGWLDLREDLSDRARPKRFYRVKVQPAEGVSETDSRVSETDSGGCPKRIPQVSETDTRTCKVEDLFLDTYVEDDVPEETSGQGTRKAALPESLERLIGEACTAQFIAWEYRQHILKWLESGGSVEALAGMVEDCIRVRGKHKVGNAKYFFAQMARWLEEDRPKASTRTRTEEPTVTWTPEQIAQVFGPRGTDEEWAEVARRYEADKAQQETSRRRVLA